MHEEQPSCNVYIDIYIGRALFFNLSPGYAILNLVKRWRKNRWPASNLMFVQGQVIGLGAAGACPTCTSFIIGSGTRRRIAKCSFA